MAEAQSRVTEMMARTEWPVEEIQKFRKEVYVQRKLRQGLEAWLSEEAGRSADKTALALAQWILGRPQEAAETLKTPGEGDGAAYIAGRICMETGAFEEAVQLLKNVGGADAETPELQILYAEALVESGDLKSAQAVLKKIQPRNDQRGEFHYVCGRCHEAGRQHKAMLESYEKAAQFEPDNARILFRLALYLDLFGEDARALEIYERCASLNPTHVNALLNLGVLYEDNGDHDKAIECYKRVLKVHPDHERAILFLKDAIASTSMFYDEELRKEQERRRQLLTTPITEFELSVRARKCLEKMRIHALADLVQKSESDLLAYKNFGDTSLREIRDLLAQKGLSLGQKVEPKPVTWYELVHTPEKDSRKEMLEKPVSELGLSVRSARCLARLRVHTLGELVDKSVAELLEIRNFGKTSLSEIQRKLSSIGFSLKPDAERVAT